MKSRLATTIIADISDSTPFYQAMGDSEAQRLIQLEIDRLRDVLLRFDGVPVGQKGDDVLGYFETENAAVKAAVEMLSMPTESLLSVHAGIHCGPVVFKDNSIFGETVNLTARLAAVANPGEVCLSEGVASNLEPDLRRLLTPIGPLRLKGVSDPVKVFSLVSPAGDLSTVRYTSPHTDEAAAHGRAAETLTVILYDGERSWRCREGGELKIGRSPDCDVVLPQPWVSRLHAVLSLKGGKLMLTDRSSSGTYIQLESGREIQLSRESIMLSDSGSISPALRIRHADARPIEFEVIHR